MKISVIIPTLNEAQGICETISAVRSLPGDFEIIVVDGGSHDGTAEIARSENVRTLTSQPGRALQMNCGAAAASGDILLFLHADTKLPQETYDAVHSALKNTKTAGGCFRLKFDDDHPVLRFSSFFSRFRFRLFHYGDCCYFVRRACFEALQGFRLLPLLEDLDFWRRLNARYKTVVLQPTVVTSARRFQRQGVVRQQSLAVLIVSLYTFGVSPARLASFYNRRQLVRQTPGYSEYAGSQLTTHHTFAKPNLMDRLTYPLAALWRWSFSNLHMTKQTLNVLDFMWWRRVGAGLLPADHPWLTGKMPDGSELIWPKNIVFATPRKQTWHGPEPESDAEIVTAIGKFLAKMVVRSNVHEPEIPQGKKRRMPHAVNYIHGSVHYNGCFVLFNDFKDAMFYLSDPKFAREFLRFAVAEHRELTVVLRERLYEPEEFAWFLGFVRARLPWYANANGPTKKRILHGTPSPYPAVNPINGSWIRDVRNLQKHRLDQIVYEPLANRDYFAGVYQGNRAEYTFLERFHAWGQFLITEMKGFQGGLVFTKRRQIEPENWDLYQTSNGKWRAGYPISHPFRSIAAARALRRSQKELILL